MNNFDHFVEQGIVKKQTPDKERANSLIEESQRKFNQIKRVTSLIGIDGENANDLVEDCYDVLIGLIRAIMLFRGFNSSGKGAHEAEVYFLEKLNFTSKEVSFTNDLRYFRNGILYYGKRFDKDYAEKVIHFMNEMIPKLEEKLKWKRGQERHLD